MQTKSFIRIVCLLYTVNKDAYIDIKITALKHLSHFDISLEWNSFRAWRVVKHTTIQRLVWWMMDDLRRYVRRYGGIGVQGTMPPTVVVPPWQFFSKLWKMAWYDVHLDGRDALRNVDKVILRVTLGTFVAKKAGKRKEMKCENSRTEERL